MEICLRELIDNDLEKYQEWIDEIEADAYMSRFFPKEFDGKVDSINSKYAWYIISVNRLVIGAIWLEKQKDEDDMVVLGILIGKKDHLGKGIGKKAIELAIEKARKKFSFNKVILNVRINNGRAISCYKKCGFHIVQKDEKLNNSGESIAFYRMELDLSSS